jgi:aryl-alcohol dehydrogenase-like predicted oxidoreductase
MNTNIVGTMNVRHLQDNIAAAARPLPADTYAEAKRRLDGVSSVG